MQNKKKKTEKQIKTALIPTFVKIKAVYVKRKISSAHKSVFFDRCSNIPVSMIMPVELPCVYKIMAY